MISKFSSVHGTRHESAAPPPERAAFRSHGGPCANPARGRSFFVLSRSARARHPSWLHAPSPFLRRVWPRRKIRSARPPQGHRVPARRSPQGRARPRRPGCSCISPSGDLSSVLDAKKAQRARGVSLGCHLRAAHVAPCVYVCAVRARARTYVCMRVCMCVCAYYSACTRSTYTGVCTTHTRPAQSGGEHGERERAKARKRSE